MPNNSLTQQALAHEPHFQKRLASCIANVAWQVLEEPAGTTNHEYRMMFARQVLTNIELAARNSSSWIVERPNLLGFETTYNFDIPAVVTAAGDADIQSQLMSDWDDLAGKPPPPPTPPPSSSPSPSSPA